MTNADRWEASYADGKNAPDFEVQEHSVFHPRDSLLQAYVDGELKAPQVAIMMGHLEHCSFCQGQVSQLKATFLRFQEMQRSLEAGEEEALAEGFRASARGDPGLAEAKPPGGRVPVEGCAPL